VSGVINIDEGPIHTIDEWGIHTIISDDVDGVAVKTVQDVEPILDANKEAYNSGRDGYTPSRAMKKVGEIPFVVAEMWMRVYGVDVFNKDHIPAVRRLLNSSDWRHLRTAPGQL
jgi:hypothetical protein